ncbi:LysR family transcriptional regulator, partial [Pseudomonas sp. JV245A]|nr:LysR family transcriptional regulator [Pseudomonas sp. JV245A]
TSPIILSRRIGEPSPGLTHCLHLIAQLRSEIGREHPIVS